MENGAQAQQPDLDTEPDADTDDKYKPLTPEEKRAEMERWTKEFTAARRWLQPLKDQAKKIEAIVRDEREIEAMLGESRWNLFAANRETKAAMLYGRPPRVSVDRRFSDESDDVARVASELTKRILNTDIERTSDGFATALGLALLDRLDCGWSMVRERYTAEWEDVAEVPAKMGPHPETGETTELAPAVPAGKRKTFEDVETDYVHLEDQLWQPCRYHHEMGWWAQKTQMTKEQTVERFGEEYENVPLNGKPPVMTEQYSPSAGADWNRADVYEVWDKEHKKVIWLVEGYEVLDCKHDPYGLDGFYPFPRPMVANPTTSKYLPRPDYVIAQDLYTELNLVTTRIKHIMQKGVRVSGAYDAKYKELADITETGGDGVFLPVQNWSMTGEGIQNAVWVFPTQEMVACVLQLRDYRRELIDAIAQVTGMSDIMRGEATTAGATATEQNLKAVMGSVRMRAISIDFARFASESQNIRAQLMSKFFDPETIAQRGNAQFLPESDKPFVQEAIQLIKSPAFSQYRIEVKPEALSLENFAQIKSERFDAAAGIGQLLNATAPLMQAMPGAAPMVFKMGQALLAGMPGASGMESAFDSGLKAAEQQAQQQSQQQPPPDPKVVAEQMKQQTAQQKGQLDMEKEQFKHQAKLQQIQAEVVADDQREASQANWNTKEAANKAAIAHAFRPPEAPKGVPQ